MAMWTATKGEGHEVLIKVRPSYRGFEEGYTAYMYDAANGEWIGSTQQGPNEQEIFEEGFRQAGNNWPNARIIGATAA